MWIKEGRDWCLITEDSVVGITRSHRGYKTTLFLGGLRPLVIANGDKSAKRAKRLVRKRVDALLGPMIDLMGDIR